MLDTLDAAAVRRWCGSGLAALQAHQHEIDELNVYPVPDGDTGTNLVLTLASAHQALALDPPTVSESGTGPQTPLGHALRLMARGALLGARGNSGVIVSQILRGMADSLAGAVAVRGSELARALRSASEAAYAAVARPVEGTVLSVVAAAAEAAARIGSDDLVAVARAAASAATEALARTPQQLPVLARAGVVDAGGRGLCLLLDALVEVLGGIAPDAAVTAVGTSAGERAASVPHHDHEHVAPGGGHDHPGYEVQYLLDAVPEAVPVLRATLAGLGDSLVIVGTGEGDLSTWNVHVHVDAAEIGPALEAGIVAGRPHRIAVTPLIEKHKPTDRDTSTTPGSPTGAGGRAGAGGGAGAGGRAGAGGEILPGGSAESGSAAEFGPVVEPEPVVGPELVVEPEPVVGPELVVGPEPVVEPDVPAESGGPGRPDRVGAGGALWERIPHARGDTEEIVTVDVRARAAVVVAAGDGLTALFVGEGATVVGRNPSTAEVLAAIRSTRAGRVVLLPNDTNTHAVAVSAAREAAGLGVRVSVVPTRSPVQALAALAVRDPQRQFSDDVIAMAEAAGACRYGEVCTARRAALTVAGQCRPGDLLGLVDGEVHIIGTDVADVCRQLLDRMLGGGGELTTLVLGADAPPGLEETLTGHVTRAWPFVEVQCYAGGQPRYHLLVGVE